METNNGSVTAVAFDVIKEFSERENFLDMPDRLAIQCEAFLNGDRDSILIQRIIGGLTFNAQNAAYMVDKTRYRRLYETIRFLEDMYVGPVEVAASLKPL